MTASARRRPARSRGPATATTPDRADLWQTKPTPAQPEVIVPAADPAALALSLGPAPLPGHAATADLYITTVVERAAALATALAASADLLAQPHDETEADDQPSDITVNIHLDRQVSLMTIPE